MYFLYSGDGLFSSLEAGYLEQCANNLKVVLVAADTPNQVCIQCMHSFIFNLSNSTIVFIDILGNDRCFSTSG